MGISNPEKIKKTPIIIPIVSGIIFLVACGSYVAKSEASFDSQQKRISITDEGLSFDVFSDAENVGGLLNQKGIKMSSDDAVFPGLDGRIYSGSRVIIMRGKKITIKEGGSKIEMSTFRKTVEQALWENNKIVLGDDDITFPSRQSFVKDGMAIEVTHVVIKEETKEESIAFKTISNEDNKLGWREKKVTQKGEAGVQEVKYKTVFHDGKEISRKILEKNITKQPVDEIVTQGTYVQTGKTHTGLASWYAHTGTMAAANPWLPMGSYVKVTNVDNGKSVIVKINDRGPFGPGRIIDLDKVAFAKIASLGAGVVNVKMEEIKN